MLCPNCESENRDGAKFCDECGFPLTGAIAARAAEAAVSEKTADEAEAAPLEENPDPIEDNAAPSVHDGVTEAIEVVDDTADEKNAPVEDAAEESTASDLPDEKPFDAQLYAEQPTTAISGDLAGLDQMENDYGERLVDPDYQQPQPNWRDGHTMQLPRIEGEEAPKSTSFLASSTTKKSGGKKKVVIGVIAAVVVLAAVIAFITYQMELWGGKALPDVRGMTEADATSVLEGGGFEVRSTQVKSDDTEGLVLVMDPTAGARANEGDEVVIHVATAREVPNIVGKTETEAKAAFAEAGYENVTFAKEHSDSPEGTVLSVSPEPGTRAKSTVPITVKVAEPYTVPDVSSLGLDGAIAAIQSEGLGYDVVYYDTQEYPDGTVLGTEPVAGTKVKSDTVVVIEVARARGIQLVQLTRDLLSPGFELTLGGTNYIVSSLSAANYLGNDQVSFTVSARPYTVFFGVYVEGDIQQVSGVVTWTPDNQVASIS